MRFDEIEYTILDDGTIRWSTDKISAANHTSADQLLKEIEQAMGGTVTRSKKKSSHGHVHEKEHQHG